MIPFAWTPEQVAELRRLYPTTSPKAVAAAVGRSLKSVYDKAAQLGIKSANPPGHLDTPRPKMASKPCLPALKPMRGATGPAYLDGPLVFTDKTRHVICARKPDPHRTNTFSQFG